ncbi:MAG: tetratricopeptide repeat protein [Thermoplasmata archaeon]|nr:tetratricopeptide repeat protein [Thermoplasmata archaeon]
MEKEGSALYLCPGCGAFVSENASKCPNCGAALDDAPEADPVDEMAELGLEAIQEPEISLETELNELESDLEDDDSEPVTLFLCSGCGAFTGGNTETCLNCGASMLEEEEPEPLIKPEDPEADLLDMLVTEDDDSAENLIEDLKKIENVEDVVNFIESIPYIDPDSDLEFEPPEELLPERSEASDDLLSLLVIASDKAEAEPEEKPSRSKALGAVKNLLSEDRKGRPYDNDSIALCSSCGTFVSETADVCNICGNALGGEKKFVPRATPDLPDDEEESANSIIRALLGVTEDAELDKEAGDRFQADGNLGLCTVCGAFISQTAGTCPVCGTHMEDMPEFMPSMDVAGPEKEVHGLALCPHCGVFVQEGAKECLSCIKPIPEGAALKPTYEEEKIDDSEDNASNILKTFLGVEKALDIEPTRDPTFTGLEICPDCGAFVSINAIACSVCGNLLFEGAGEMADLDKQIGDLEHINCPNCGSRVDSNSAECPFCRMVLSAAEEALHEGPGQDITDFLEFELEDTIKALESRYAALEPEPLPPKESPFDEKGELSEMLVIEEDDYSVPEYDISPMEISEDEVLDEIPDMVSAQEAESLEFIEPEIIEEFPVEEFEAESLMEQEIAPESPVDLSRFDTPVHPSFKVANWATGVYGSIAAICIFIFLYLIAPGDYYAPGLALIFGAMLLLGIYLFLTEKGTFFRGDIMHASVFISGFLVAAVVILHWPLGFLNSDSGLMGQPAFDRILLSISILLTCIGLLWIRARVRFIFTWFSGTTMIFLATLVAYTQSGFIPDSLSPAVMVAGLGTALIFLSFIFLLYENAIYTSIESDIVRGDAHYMKRNYGKALASYDDALTKSQMKRVEVLGSPLVEYDVPWYSKGSALILMGQFEEGIKCLDMALAINPNNEVTWVNKGNAHSKQGERNIAVECYRRAIECNPFYEIAWNNMGNAHARQKEYVEALKHYNRAIKINQNYDDAWINKGYVLAKMGKREQAIKCLNHVGARAKGQMPPIEHDVQTL